VKVGQKNVLDLATRSFRVVDILRHVALWVNDRCGFGLGIGNQIRRV
jgi:hypothetical protein